MAMEASNWAELSCAVQGTRGVELVEVLGIDLLLIPLLDSLTIEYHAICSLHRHANLEPCVSVQFPDTMPNMQNHIS